MTSNQAFLNGRWVDASSVALPLDDVGFQLGVTVVERLRTFGGAPFQVEGHLRRLERSLQIVGWDAARIVRQVRGAIGEYCERNRPLMAPGDDWAIVAIVSPGRSADAADPWICVYGFPLAFASFAHQYDQGVHLCVTDVRQTPTNCWPAELKCRSRMHYYLADREAARRFPGSRAVLLDQRGFVGEASTANIVCWYEQSPEHGGRLVIPRQEGVLPGISQAFLFELADQLGVERREADLTPEQLASADEVLLTSTSVCVLPVVRVDHAKIGAGKPGPMHAKLLAAWSERVGVDIAAQARQFAKRD
ncbi:MAG TPA: aminotransferase class IV [Lacipirellulaceae bacterium]|nr:aminotransferase class IV [Lacipirellulaceae bacterium]